MNARRLRRIALLGTALCALVLGGCSSLDDPQGANEIAGRAAQGTTPANVTAATLISIADKTRASGDLGSAIGFYRRAISLDPTKPKAYASLADTLNMAGAPNEAVEAIRAGLAVAPNDPELLRGFGFTLLALNQPAGAIEQFQKALAISKDASTFDGLGVAQDLLGDYKSAEVSYRAGLALSPTDLNLRNNLGLSQALSENFDAAIDTLHAVATDGAAGPRQRLNLALVLGLAGKTEEAAQIARIDLDERSVRSNVTYYLQLRALPPELRAQAILNPGAKGLPPARVPANNTASVPSEAQPVAASDDAPEKPVAAKPAKAAAPSGGSASFSAQVPEKVSAAPVPAVKSEPLPVAMAAPATVVTPATAASRQDPAVGESPDAASLADREPTKPEISKPTQVTAESSPPDRREAPDSAQDAPNPVNSSAEAASPKQVARSTDNIPEQPSPESEAKARPFEEPTPVLPPTAEVTPVEEPIPVPPPATEVSDVMQNAPATETTPPADNGSAQTATPVATAAATEEHTDAVAEEKPASDGTPTQIASAPAGIATAEEPAAPAAETQRIASNEPVSSAPPSPVAEAPATDATPEVAVRSDVSGKWIQLGALRDENAAELSWDRILRRNDDLLKSVGHAVRRTDLGPDRGVYFRLRAGPFSSIDDARSLCSSLKSRKVACFVVAI